MILGLCFFEAGNLLTDKLNQFEVILTAKYCSVMTKYCPMIK